VPDWAIQNPSVLATRATRKTTRFGQRDEKYNAAFRHAPSQHGRASQRVESRLWIQQERVGQENLLSTLSYLLSLFPMAFEAHWEKRSGQEPNNPQIPWERRVSLPRATLNTTRVKNTTHHV
jgi:hypothetical protein